MVTNSPSQSRQCRGCIEKASKNAEQRQAGPACAPCSPSPNRPLVPSRHSSQLPIRLTGAMSASEKTMALERKKLYQPHPGLPDGPELDPGNVARGNVGMMDPDTSIRIHARNNTGEDKERITQLETENADLTQRLDTVKKDKTNRSSIADLGKHNLHLTDENEAYHNQIVSLQKALEAKTKECDSHIDRARELKQREENALFDIANMHELYDATKKEKGELEAFKVASIERERSKDDTIEALKDDLQHSHARTNQMTTRLKRMDQLRLEQESQVALIRSEVAQAEEEIASLEFQNETLEDQRQQLLEMRHVLHEFFNTDLDLSPSGLADVITDWMREQSSHPTTLNRPKKNRVVSLQDELADDDYDRVLDDAGIPPWRHTADDDSDAESLLRASSPVSDIEIDGHMADDREQDLPSQELPSQDMSSKDVPTGEAPNEDAATLETSAQDRHIEGEPLQSALLNDAPTQATSNATYITAERSGADDTQESLTLQGGSNSASIVCTTPTLDHDTNPAQVYEHHPWWYWPLVYMAAFLACVLAAKVAVGARDESGVWLAANEDTRWRVVNIRGDSRLMFSDWSGFEKWLGVDRGLLG